jgi:hypothetical protein
VGVAASAAELDTGVFKNRRHPFIVPGRKLQGHVIDFTAAVDAGAIVDFEQRHALIAALEKTLPGSLVIDLHAKKIDVKLLRSREILDVKNHVIDAADCERGVHNLFTSIGARLRSLTFI